MASKPLSLRLRAELFTQLAQLETSGLPLDRSLALLQIGGDGAARLQEMKKRVARGEVPGMAGEKSGVFTRLEARLIHAAWNAGSLGAIYRRLGELYTQRAMQLATMKSRLVLPAIVLVMALLIQPVPALVSGAIGAGGYLLGVVKPLLVIALALFLGRLLWQRMVAAAAASPAPTPLTGLPLVGTLLVRQNIRDFLQSLALMLEAGISMLDALPLALDTIGIGAIRQQFAQLKPRIERGETLSQALATVTFLAALDSGARAVEFARTGEQSGTLPEMLLRHVVLETDAVDAFYQQAAQWLPRIGYSIIVLWMALGILTSGALLPNVPKDL